MVSQGGKPTYPKPGLFLTFWLESKIGKKAIIVKKPIQTGDVPNTYADVLDLFEYINFKPQTDIKAGIANFIDWYISYYRPTLIN